MLVCLRWAVLLALALIVGCGRSQAPPAPPPVSSAPPVEPEPRLFLRNEPDFVVKILADDIEVANSDGKKLTANGKISHEVFNEAKGTVRITRIALERKPEKVKVLGAHPDGWTEGVATGGVGSAVEFKKPDHWKEEILLIDNRGGKPAEIAVGEMKLAAPADWKGSLHYLRPSAPGSSVVRIDGKEVGTLWSEKTAPPKWGEERFFIDVTGRRSYLYREVHYSITNAAELLDLKPLRKELGGRHVHRLPSDISFFLERAPAKIIGKDGSFVEKATELTER